MNVVWQVQRMKKLVAIFTLVISTVMFASPLYAEWTKVETDLLGNEWFVDFSRIREHNGDIYYWEVTNYLRPWPDGILSASNYKQANCSVFRFKHLVDQYFKTPMAKRIPHKAYNTVNEDWTYPKPNSMAETVLTAVCDRVS